MVLVGNQTRVYMSVEHVSHAEVGQTLAEPKPQNTSYSAFARYCDQFYPGHDLKAM